MWPYESVTRQEFESIKDVVETYIVMLGGKKYLLNCLMNKEHVRM